MSSWGGLFWGEGGETGWGCAALHCTGGCQRVVLYPGAGERRVGVLAAVPAAQLLQGLQAGCPAAQALLASDSVHQTETGQQFDRWLCPGPRDRSSGHWDGDNGGTGAPRGGKSPPSSARALGSIFSMCQRDLAGQATACLCSVYMYSCFPWRSGASQCVYGKKMRVGQPHAFPEHLTGLMPAPMG